MLAMYEPSVGWRNLACFRERSVEMCEYCILSETWHAVLELGEYQYWNFSGITYIANVRIVRCKSVEQCSLPSLWVSIPDFDPMVDRPGQDSAGIEIRV